VELIKCGRRAQLYRRLMAEPPQPGVDVTSMNNIMQMRQAKVDVPCALDDAQNLQAWGKMLTNNVFASFFEKSRESVDLMRVFFRDRTLHVQY
jgi:hypothetical protein